MAEKKAKPVRLNKVAKEINVGVTTIVEFLQENGVECEASPNAKIEPQHYELILEEFKPDLLTKERSKEANIGRKPKETIAIDYMADKGGAAKEADKPADGEQPADAQGESTEQETVTADVPEETTETDEKAPVAEETTAGEAEAEGKTEETPETKDEETGAAAGLNVVGKIDLSNLNQKTRPGKKSKEEVAKEKEARKEVEAKIKKDREQDEVKKREAEAGKKEEQAKEEQNKQREEKKQKAEGEVIRARADKLSGPTVVGKIELPVDKRAKKREEKKSALVGSSEDPGAGKKKRKRKRISKVDVDEAGRKARAKSKKKGVAGNKPELTEEDIQKEIKDTLARLSGGGKSKAAKNRRAKREAVSQKIEEQRQKEEEEKSVLQVTEFVTVGEIASMMDVSPTEVISACMSLGIFATINQRLDAETLVLIAEEFGYEIEFVKAEDQEIELEEPDDEANLQERPPIVTVMGHVDHGKTSLLDYYRNTNVIAREAGGITQHIGAYSVEVENGKRITFLDTPGHEAFTAMRARGAQITDIAIIVIAADDSVKPQTREAINHAQAAGVPMIIAINKMDKPEANADKVREELAGMDILVEDWGGKYQCQEISAKKGTNMESLLEKVLLEAEVLELKADSKKRGTGAVVESTLDKGRGYVTTLVVQGGTMRVGDVVLAGSYSGRVKAMHNEFGQPVEEAGPSAPVSMLGLTGAASAGDRFYVLEDERDARDIATRRQQLQREQGIRTQKHITLDEIGRRLALGDFKELNLVLKGDVDGSIEALSDALLKLSTENIQVNIIHKAVGPITESDVLLASASDAIIVGFQVRPVASAKKLAEKEEIDIRLYSIIYDAIEELKAAMEGMLSPDIKEEITGTAEVRDVFKITKVGTVAGCFVQEGKLFRNNKVRLIRDGVVIYTGDLGSLKRFKDDVKEVSKGYECGLNIANYNDIKEGDLIECYEEVEVKRTL